MKKYGQITVKNGEIPVENVLNNGIFVQKNYTQTTWLNNEKKWSDNG